MVLRVRLTGKSRQLINCFSTTNRLVSGREWVQSADLDKNSSTCVLCQIRRTKAVTEAREQQKEIGNAFEAQRKCQKPFEKTQLDTFPLLDFYGSNPFRIIIPAFETYGFTVVCSFFISLIGLWVSVFPNPSPYSSSSVRWSCHIVALPWLFRLF